MWSVRGEAGVRFILFYCAKKGEINEPLFAKSPVRKSLGMDFPIEMSSPFTWHSK